MRLYAPKSEALTGKWNPPPVMRVPGGPAFDDAVKLGAARWGSSQKLFQIRTLTGIGKGGAISQRPRLRLERLGWPDVVAIEADMLPAQRGNVGRAGYRAEFRIGAAVAVAASPEELPVGE